MAGDHHRRRPAAAGSTTAALAVLLVSVAAAGCGGEGSRGSGLTERPSETTPSRVVRLTDLEPVTADTPIAPSGEAPPARDDAWTAAEATAVADDRQQRCWLYSTSGPADAPASGGGAVLLRDGTEVPSEGTPTGPFFTFSRPRAQLVVSTGREQKAGASEGSWSGSSAASFLLPAGPTRLVLRAPETPPEAPPLEIELWMDGAKLAMEFLEVGVLADTTVELLGGRHDFELRCPRLQTAPWASLVRPIELTLDIESSRGMVLLYPGGVEPPDRVELRYTAGSSAARGWVDSLASAGAFDLHRRLVHGCCEHDAIVAPTPTALAYSVEVPPDGRLVFGLRRAPATAAKVFGEIHVDAGDGPRSVWTGLARDLDGCRAGVEVVSLAALANQRVILSLSTRSESGEVATAYWTEPMILASPPAAEGGAPGVILVSIDTLRADHLGCYGYDRPTSPALDDLAAGATQYRRAYSTYPTTMLSHMALLRGTHPDGLSRSLAHEAGLDPEAHAPDPVAMVQQQLRAQGWLTAAFTGGGAVDKHFGFSEGFDAYCDCRGDDAAGALADRAARWLENHAGSPFFLFLHTYEVHGPYAPPGGFTERAGGAAGLDAIDPYAILGHPADPCAPLDDTTRDAMVDLYDGEIRYTDQALVGGLLDTLERLDLTDDTLLVVTSDHGEEFGEHGCWLHGTHLYEETVHVPLIVRYPGGQHRGEVIDGPVSLVDVAPTILATVGLEHADMQGTALPRSSDHERGAASVARGMRFIVEGAELITSKAFVAGQPFKLVHSLEPPAEPRLELYDLQADPGEERDRLAADESLEGSPAHDALARLRRITDPTVGEPLLRLEGGAAGDLPPELDRQLEALGYTR